MKSRHLLVAAAAFLVSTGCNADQSNQSSNGGSEPVAAVPPPEGCDWTKMVVKTPEGGFLMGNPDAKVKLVEYGSMTCPHCAEFAEASKALVDNYVKSGNVSFEFRNYVRDPFDLTASLVARCGGEQSFFPLTEAMFASQDEWFEKLQAVPQEQMQSIMTLGPQRQFLEIAKLAGFQQWAAQRGLPSARTTACLTNEQDVNQLVQMNGDTTTQYPQFQGTPSFTINGEMLDRTASWEALEPQLREALGG